MPCRLAFGSFYGQFLNFSIFQHNLLKIRRTQMIRIIKKWRFRVSFSHTSICDFRQPPPFYKFDTLKNVYFQVYVFRCKTTSTLLKRNLNSITLVSWDHYQNLVFSKLAGHLKTNMFLTPRYHRNSNKKMDFWHVRIVKYFKTR